MPVGVIVVVQHFFEGTHPKVSQGIVIVEDTALQQLNGVIHG